MELTEQQKSLIIEKWKEVHGFDAISFRDTMFRVFELVLDEMSRREPKSVEYKVHHGEVCYKSTHDDQSYGMWCPVDLSEIEGKMLYTHPTNNHKIKKLEDQLTTAVYANNRFVELNSELTEKLRVARDAIKFAVKPLCMCFAGCDECHPDPAPPTLEYALGIIDEK